MKNILLFVALLAVLVAGGCGTLINDSFLDRNITQIDLFDQKINYRTSITNHTHIADITNQLAQVAHGWRRNWITPPLPYWSLTFHEDTNTIGTLFIGADWMMYNNLIRTSTPQENGALWDAVEKGQSMTARSYRLIPSYVMINADNENDDGENVFTQMNTNSSLNINEMFVQFLEGAGMQFPQGSYLNIDTNSYIVTITNTEQNLEIFENLHCVGEERDAAAWRVE